MNIGLSLNQVVYLKPILFRQQLECSREKERGLESRVHKLTSDLMDAQVRIRELERQLSQATHEQDLAVNVRHELADKEFTYFKEALASILSSSYYPCSPTEVAIKEHARRIITEHKNRKRQDKVHNSAVEVNLLYFSLHNNCLDLLFYQALCAFGVSFV
ncbi:hypothetical protein AHF37_09618 [Paragonimus kellicotti]|nr:hypothetical protein AHF37_09618 [Paragonimus kellicotti]